MSLQTDTALQLPSNSNNPNQSSRHRLSSQIRQLYHRLVVDWWTFEINRLVLMTGYAIDPITSSPIEFLNLRSLPLVDSGSRQAFLGDSIAFKDVPSPMTNFILSSTPGGIPGMYSNSTPTSQECIMYWCTKTFQSSVFEGDLIEETIDVEPIDGIKNHSPNEEVSFGVSNTTAVQMKALLNGLFSFSSTFSNWTTGAQATFLTTPQSFTLDAKMWISPSSVTGNLETLANAMTNYMRDAPTGDFVIGTAWSPLIICSVRYIWLTFPACLLLLSVVFLAAPIRKSSRDAPQIGV